MARKLRTFFWIVGAPVLLLLFFVALQAVRGPEDVVRLEEVLEHPVASRAPVPADDTTDEGRTSMTETAVTPAIQPAGDALRVVISLEEGEFKILPGEPGDPIRIDADYDSGNFTLDHGYVSEGEGGGEFRLDFRRTVSVLRTLFRPETATSTNRIRLYLPPEILLALRIELSKGQQDVDLSGLAVASLDLETAMGQTNLVFRELNPVAMDLLRVDAGMGEFNLDGLGNADVRRLEVDGSMGQINLEFDGHSRGATEVFLEMTMGSALIEIPPDRPYETVSSSAFLGEILSGRGQEPTNEDEAARLLTFDLAVTMGNIEVD